MPKRCIKPILSEVVNVTLDGHDQPRTKPRELWCRPTAPFGVADFEWKMIDANEEGEPEAELLIEYMAQLPKCQNPHTGSVASMFEWQWREAV